MRIEVDISRGLFCFNIVGLADKTMTESRHRILSALKNCQYELPQKKNEKVTVSLMPANKRKVGAYADLGIAFAYLKASGQMHQFSPDEPICCIGEIQLDGTVLVKEDIIHILYAAVRCGIKAFIIPKTSTEYMHLIPGIEVLEISSLADLKNTPLFTISKDATKQILFDEIKEGEKYSSLAGKSFEIDKLKGLHHQKRALSIGLAGNHPTLFAGPPGSGKSALANCASELIDQLTNREAIETYSIYHSGLQTNTSRTRQDFFIRPLRRPHHLTTAHRLIDGGNSPGELFLAHNGIIILDELCEFDRVAIESLREPLDRKYIPSRKNDSSPRPELVITVIATTNTCPCGRKSFSSIEDNQLQSKQKNQEYCICTPYQIKKYQSKISEPLLDRFAIVCAFQYEDHKTCSDMQAPQENIGKAIVQTIAKARNTQRQRNAGKTYNHYLHVNDILKYGITTSAKETLAEIEKAFSLSKRKIEHTIKIARTIADLENSPTIDINHLMEAVGYVKTKPFN